MSAVNLVTIIDRVGKLAQEVSDIEVNMPDIDLSLISDEEWENAGLGDYDVIEETCQDAFIENSEELFEQLIHVRDELLAIQRDLSLLQPIILNV